MPLSDFSRQLYRLHRRNQPFTNTILRSHLHTLSAMFRAYSGLFPEFAALPAGDRRQLLDHNTRIFAQYFLGRYFYAGSGFKQTQWLLLCQVGFVGNRGCRYTCIHCRISVMLHQADIRY